MVFSQQNDFHALFPQDFKEQIVHHIATIFLLGFSYCSNYVRVGTLVMLVHDSSDFLLEVKTSHEALGCRVSWSRQESVISVVVLTAYRKVSISMSFESQYIMCFETLICLCVSLLLLISLPRCSTMLAGRRRAIPYLSSLQSCS